MHEAEKVFTYYFFISDVFNYLIFQQNPCLKTQICWGKTINYLKQQRKAVTDQSSFLQPIPDFLSFGCVNSINS